MYSCQKMLIHIIRSATVSTMVKSKEQDEVGVWNFRDVPRNAIVKAKIGAALEGLSVKAYFVKLVEENYLEMERKGILPKGK